MRGEESVWLVFTVLYPLCKKSLNSEKASNIEINSGKENKTALLYNEDIKGDKTSLEHSLSSKASQRICEFCLKQWRSRSHLSTRLFQNGLLFQMRSTSITTKLAFGSFGYEETNLLCFWTPEAIVSWDSLSLLLFLMFLYSYLFFYYLF